MEHYKLTIKGYDCSHVKLIEYPDSQVQVELDLEYFNNRKIPVDIECRIRNFSELEHLLAIISALQWADFLIYEIRFIYLFGMRSDRLFKPGQSHYFRDVIAPIINGMPGNKKFLEPHGRSLRYIMFDAWHTNNVHYSTQLVNADKKLMIAGDESAVTQCDHLAGFSGDFYKQCFFHKVRTDDESLTISLNRNAMEYIKNSELETLLIVDDLCDAGGTFIAESKYLREHFPDRKLHLFVVHGLFTKGLEHISDHFDRIFTTNSYQDFPQNPDDPLRVTDKLKVIKVI